MERGEEQTIIPNSQNSRSFFFFFSEVQRKYDWFSGIGGNTINSNHAVQSPLSDLSFHALLTLLDSTLELSRKNYFLRAYLNSLCHFSENHSPKLFSEPNENFNEFSNLVWYVLGMHLINRVISLDLYLILCFLVPNYQWFIAHIRPCLHLLPFIHSFHIPLLRTYFTSIFYLGTEDKDVRPGSWPQGACNMEIFQLFCKIF